MTTQTHREGTARRLAVDGEMTIYTAADLKQRLLDQLAGAGSLELDLSQVAEMDSAGLQVLLMAKAEAGRHAVELQVSNYSRAVFDVLELLGMQSDFSDSVVIPAEWRQS